MHGIACCHSCLHFIYRLLTRRDCGRHNRTVIKVIKSLQPTYAFIFILSPIFGLFYTWFFPSLLLV